MKNHESGTVLSDVVILVTLCIVIFLFIIPARRGMHFKSTPGLLGSYIGSPTPGSLSQGSGNPNSEWTAGLKRDSDKAGQIYVGVGGTYTNEPDAEYITILNRGAATNISGWTLTNAKDKRVYTLGGTIQHFPKDVINIPQGTLFISPNGNNRMQNIILERGDEAIVTTGHAPSNTRYKLVSFKENKCSGYLGQLDDISFRPELSDSCPLPIREPGTTSLDKECRNFISSMGQCHTPKYDEVVDGDVCNGCVDRQPLTSQCVAFIKAHYGYDQCIANHASDPDFYLHTWRIFLNRGWDMWAEGDEIVSLFDGSGRLVDFRSY